VVAAMPAFAVVRDWVLGIGGGPLVSLAAATNVLAALTGSASGGLTIALDALGDTYLALAGDRGIDPSLLHRVAVIGSGTLDSLPHNGAVVTLLAVCETTHRESYLDIVMVGIVGALIALGVVIGSARHSGRFDMADYHQTPISNLSGGIGSPTNLYPNEALPQTDEACFGCGSDRQFMTSSGRTRLR
jgi:Mg2+/citrate symporter